MTTTLRGLPGFPPVCLYEYDNFRCWSRSADGHVIVALGPYSSIARSLGIPIRPFEKWWFLVTEADAWQIRAAYVHPHNRYDAWRAGMTLGMLFRNRERRADEFLLMKELDHRNIADVWQLIGEPDRPPSASEARP